MLFNYSNVGVVQKFTAVLVLGAGSQYVLYLHFSGHIIGNGRYMGHIPNSGNFASCLAELLLGLLDGHEDDGKATEANHCVT